MIELKGLVDRMSQLDRERYEYGVKIEEILLAGKPGRFVKRLFSKCFKSSEKEVDLGLVNRDIFPLDCIGYRVYVYSKNEDDINIKAHTYWLNTKLIDSPEYFNSELRKLLEKNGK